jgi:hypothetical protein
MPTVAFPQLIGPSYKPISDDGLGRQINAVHLKTLPEKERQQFATAATGIEHFALSSIFSNNTAEELFTDERCRIGIGRQRLGGPIRFVEKLIQSVPTVAFHN